MKTTVFLSLAICAAFLCGCRHLTLTNFDTGETLKAKSYSLPRSIYVTMSDGEVLKGKFATVSGESIGVGFATATANGTTAFGNSTSYAVGGPGSVYALLKSTKPGSHLMMELTAVYSPFSGHGYGQARTNDGRTYKIVF